MGLGLLAIVMSVALAVPAMAAEVMRVTFVRHAESQANVDHSLDSSVPGPNITVNGQQQAQALIGKLGNNNYDAVYASTMVRTQQTAAPLAGYLGLPVTVLPGLQEIEAGDYEDLDQNVYGSAYVAAPLAWSMPSPVDGKFHPEVKQPCHAANGCNNVDLDGYIFDKRVDDALQTMYTNGDRNALVFSHGGTIMFWVFMNAKNLTIADKVAILTARGLDNTDYVVVEGNNEDGWVILEWNSKNFKKTWDAEQPTLQEELQLQTRTLTRQVIKVGTDIVSTAMANPTDPVRVISEIGEGVGTAAHSVQKYSRAVSAAFDREFGTSAAMSSLSNPTNLLSGNAAITELKKALPTGNGADLSSAVSGNKLAADLKQAGDQVTNTVKASLQDTVSKVNDAVKKVGDSVKKVTDSVGAAS